MGMPRRCSTRGLCSSTAALAGDADGAAVLIVERAEAPLAEVYDRVLLPALAQARAERDRGDLDAAEEGRVYRAARAVLAGPLAVRRPREAAAPADGTVVVDAQPEGRRKPIAVGMLADLATLAGYPAVVVTAARRGGGGRSRIGCRPAER